MKELVIISGKGGTGKTLVASSFLSLYAKSVGADCDVDTPNLHLFMKPEINEEEHYYGPGIAVLNKSKCIACGKCMENLCRFHAIKNGNLPSFNPYYCRGCGLCGYICPADAISMEERICGQIYSGKSHDNMIVYGRLKPGHLGSGKMVVQVKNKAGNMAIKKGYNILITDASAGIGCKVIASLSGASMALIVTEPTLSAISDMIRTIELTEYFKIPVSVCINKCGVNYGNEKKIADYCSEKSIDLLQKLPMDENFYINKKGEIPVISSPESELSVKLNLLWKEIMERLSL